MQRHSGEPVSMYASGKMKACNANGMGGARELREIVGHTPTLFVDVAMNVNVKSSDSRGSACTVRPHAMHKYTRSLQVTRAKPRPP